MLTFSLPQRGEGAPKGRVGGLIQKVSIERSRQLRKTMTPEEVRLWIQLRHLRTDGFHFRRQTPLLGYYPDFVCLRHKLIVELDGSHHGDDPDQATHDERRDQRLSAVGFRVIRFQNGEVWENLDGLLATIMGALTGEL